MLDVMEPIRRTGTESFIDCEGNTISSLLDFWQWAYSDLIGNTERGAIAEYLVAHALGVDEKTRINWDRYDILSSKGIKIEVKASGYIQTWRQEKLSSIIFGIQKTHGWDAASSKYDEDLKRQADVYVFCLLKHTDQRTINPLNLSQWVFYLVKTQVLDRECGDQKSISLKRLEEIGGKPCVYEELAEAIRECGRAID